MALLIVDLDKRIGNAKAWYDTFAEKLPDLEIRIWPDPGRLADIEYLAFMHPDFDALPVFPNLKAMFSRSAGVESFIRHPNLPRVPLCKVEPPGGDPMMTEYVVMHVLRFHRDMPGYAAAQANREWRRTTIVRPDERRVRLRDGGWSGRSRRGAERRESRILQKRVIGRRMGRIARKPVVRRTRALKEVGIRRLLLKNGVDDGFVVDHAAAAIHDEFAIL